MIRSRLVSSLVTLFVVFGASDLVAQSAAAGRQSLRPYWHVFIAYALVIVILGAWAFSIGRRLRDVENRLSD